MVNNVKREVTTLSDFIIDNEVLVKYVGQSEEVIIPKGITTIGALAFADCKITNSVKRNGYGTFENCHNLINTYLPNRFKEYTNEIFGKAVTVLHFK
jgi:hypothetical protein